MPAFKVVLQTNLPGFTFTESHAILLGLAGIRMLNSPLTLPFKFESLPNRFLQYFRLALPRKRDG